MGTKLEDSSFSHSINMKGDPKCKNRGNLGVIGSLKVIGNVTNQ